MKESSHNKRQFVTELDGKIKHVLSNNPNWVDEAKENFLVNVNLAIGATSQNTTTQETKEADEEVDCDSGVDNASDNYIIEAVALL